MFIPHKCFFNDGVFQCPHQKQRGTLFNVKIFPAYNSETQKFRQPENHNEPDQSFDKKKHEAPEAEAPEPVNKFFFLNNHGAKLINPIRNKKIRVMAVFGAVAHGREDKFFSIGREHRKGIEHFAEGDLFQSAAIRIYHE